MILEVANKIYVGDGNSYEYDLINYKGWAIVHAAKNPWHRRAVGYTGRGCPKDHPEYLYAVRGNELSLNMVDVDNPGYFHKDMINFALGFMLSHNQERLLIHCNLGCSRSAGLAILLLAIIGELPKTSFAGAEKRFKEKYPPCDIRLGFRTHLIQNWDYYMGVV